VRPPLSGAGRRLAPQVGRSWTGGATNDFAPSDSTGAVGTSRFVQLVNSAFSVYDKGVSAPLATGPLSTLAGVSAGDSLFDVQVIWDPTTKRFYYAMIDMNPAGNNLAFGFSRDSTPNGGSGSDWCKYRIGFGTQFPDFPKLGDSKNFALIGVNVFHRQRLHGRRRPRGPQAAIGLRLPELAEARHPDRPQDQLVDAGLLARPGERDRHQGQRLDRRPPVVDPGDETRRLQGHQGPG
jgi:hypothetical protein